MRGAAQSGIRENESTGRRSAKAGPSNLDTRLCKVNDNECPFNIGLSKLDVQRRGKHCRSAVRVFVGSDSCKAIESLVMRLGAVVEKWEAKVIGQSRP